MARIRAYQLVRRGRARTIGRTSAARAGASASCSARASPCRPGFVVSTAAFERFLEALERDGTGARRGRGAARRRPRRDRGVLGALCARASRRPHCRATCSRRSPPRMRRFAPSDGIPAVAVRSSATTEDAVDASFAGLQDTYLWVRSLRPRLAHGPQLLGEPLLGRVGELSAQARIPGAGVAMAVVVQRMVDARTAGVMFTRSPTHRRPVGHHDRSGLGTGLRGRRRRGDAGSMGHRQDHGRDFGAGDISDKAIQHLPAAAGGVDAVTVPEERRRARLLERRGAAAAARNRRAGSNATTAAPRTSNGRSTAAPARSCCCRAGPRPSGRRRRPRRSRAPRTIRSPMSCRFSEAAVDVSPPKDVAEIIAAARGIDLRRAVPGARRREAELAARRGGGARRSRRAGTALPLAARPALEVPASARGPGRVAAASTDAAVHDVSGAAARHLLSRAEARRAAVRRSRLRCR